MLKKIFTVFLVTGFFVNICAVQALALNNHPIEKKRIIDNGKLIENIHLMIERINRTSPEKRKILDKLCKEKFGSSLECTLDEFQSLSDQYLHELDWGDWLKLTPGCFSEWILSYLGLFALTPYVTYYAIYSIYEGDQSCFLKYASWAITSLSISFISWTQYRICTELHKAVPDEEVLEGLQDDKDFLIKLSMISFVAGYAFDLDCDKDYFWND